MYIVVLSRPLMADADPIRPVASGTGTPKKPWYLVAALMGALGLGAGGGCEGHRIVSLYRAEHLDPSAFAQEITNTVDREAVRSAVQGYVDALGLAQGRAFPLAIAALLIGLATVLLA